MFKPKVHPKIPITNVLFAMLFPHCCGVVIRTSMYRFYRCSRTGRGKLWRPDRTGHIVRIESRSIFHCLMVLFDASCCGIYSTVQCDTRKSILITLNREGWWISLKTRSTNRTRNNRWAAKCCLTNGPFPSHCHRLIKRNNPSWPWWALPLYKIQGGQGK